MAPGLISEVPGFERPEQPQEPVASPTGPLISSVPGMSAPEALAVPRTVPAPDAVLAPPTMEAAIPADLAPPAPPAFEAPPPPPPPPPPAEPEVTEPPALATHVPVDEASDVEDIDATRLVARPPRLVLRWDDGTVTTIEASAVIGRDPVGQNGETPAAIDDSSRSLSKTHARFIAGYSPSVEDLHSTNGVRIERAGVPVAVPPGQAVTLRPGDEVVCGTRRLTIEVQA